MVQVSVFQLWQKAKRCNLPCIFTRVGYKKCGVTLDYAGVFIERPKSLNSQTCTKGCQQTSKTLKTLDFEKLTLTALKFVVFSSKAVKANPMPLKIYVCHISFFFFLKEKDLRLLFLNLCTLFVQIL